MAFDMLGSRLQAIFKKLKGQTHLSESNMEEVLQEIRSSLLDADVNYGVVKDFIKKVKQQLIGLRVEESLNPEQMVIKVVNEEIANLLGNEDAPLNLTKRQNNFLIVGLQGGGKTTSAVKLASHLRDKKHRPLLVACDVYRPAAIDQLIQLSIANNHSVYFEKETKDVLGIVKRAQEYARINNYDIVIYDTAGRLHVDDELMEELSEIEKEIKPSETLIVVDAMSGQDAVNVVKAFDEQINISGAIMTKLDGDARGGAALSIASLTGIKIKFAGIGEKVEDFEIFHPKRMSERILGMGDILRLIEKAQESIDEKRAEKLTRRMLSGNFDLEDMLEQLEMANKMGPLGALAKFLPGAPKLSKEDQVRAEKRMKKTKSVIYSMTKTERKNPTIIRSSHKIRIAKGSGLDVSDVNLVLRQYEQTKIQMKQMSSMFKGRMPRF